MSRVDELVAEFAPRGVEFKPLGALCTVFNGYAFKSMLFNADRIGLPIIRIRDVNTGFSDTYYSGEFDERWVVESGDILIGMDGDFRANRWKHGRALLNQRVCRLQDFSAELLPDFIFYQIQDELDRIHSSITGSTVKHLSSRELERSRVPVPPLKVQREIVRVLDQFTQLEVELEAELEARRRQYGYYRDSLLAFREATVEWIPMGEVGEFIRGRRFVKDDIAAEGIPAIHYGEIYTRYGVSTTSINMRLRPELAPTLRYARTGDVVIADVGETVEDVGKAVAWLGSGDVAIHDHSFAFRHAQNPSFVSYYLQTAAFQRQKAKYVARTKVKTLSMPGIAKICIPVPSLEEQNRIVAILNDFDALVNDLNIGLPAELAARRKQYEYYRDKLLTFKEIAA